TRFLFGGMRMAIIDNIRKVSDTVWELPVTHKEGMRVPARIIATEKLVRDMDTSGGRQLPPFFLFVAIATEIRRFLAPPLSSAIRATTSNRRETHQQHAQPHRWLS